MSTRTNSSAITQRPCCWAG